MTTERNTDVPSRLELERQTRRDYETFLNEMSSSPVFSELHDYPDLFTKVIRLHPNNPLQERLSAIESVSEDIEENQSVRDIVSPGIIRLLDENELLYPRQVNIEAVGKLQIGEALPKLRDMFKNPPNKYVREGVLEVIRHFSYEHSSVEEIVNQSLDAEDEEFLRKALYKIDALDLPDEVITRVWEIFEEEEGMSRLKIASGFLLSKKDPEKMSEVIIELFEETLNIVGAKELMRSPWKGWYPRYDLGMSEEELEVKKEALEERREILWSWTPPCLDNMDNSDNLIGKLNEWLALDLGRAEDEFIIMALSEKGNLETIHTMIDRQSNPDSIIPASTFLSFFSMVSRNYEEFRGDEKLENFLGRLLEHSDYSQAVKAIRDGKKLKIVSPPYSVGLAVDE